MFNESARQFVEQFGMAGRMLAADHFGIGTIRLLRQRAS
jgi:hypothetical protein